MAFGILEDYQTPMPMGTVILNETFKSASNLRAKDSQFPHAKTDGSVILQPQPSDSPNDPLNWSTRHKYMLASFLMIVVTTVGAVNGMLGTGTRILAERYNATFPQVIAKMTPPYVATHAVALFFTSAIAAVWGKRIQYVGAIIIIWGCMLAGWFAYSLDYYLVLRIFEGLAAAPMDLLMAPIITDMTFVHQRGSLMAVQAIVHVIGGDASFAVLAPFVVMVYLFVWETTYIGKRPEHGTRDGLEAPQEVLDCPKPSSKKETIKHFETLATKTVSIESSSDKYGAGDIKKTFKQQLVVYNGRLTNRSFFKALVQPFPLMIFPTVIFSTVVNGAFLTWMVTSGIISQQVLQYPPYNLKPDTLAYIGLPGSVVGLSSAIAAGLMNDKLIQFMAKRNKGVYEPEFRLISMIPGIVLTTFGFYLSGSAYANREPVWKIVCLGLFFHAGGPFASSATLTYIYDTHARSTAEAFVATSLFKSMFIFFTARYVPKWFEQAGPVKCFNTLAVLNVAFASLTIPMYIYGKRLRGMVRQLSFGLIHFKALTNTADFAKPSTSTLVTRRYRLDFFICHKQ